MAKQPLGLPDTILSSKDMNSTVYTSDFSYFYSVHLSTPINSNKVMIVLNEELLQHRHTEKPKTNHFKDKLYEDSLGHY